MTTREVWEDFYSWLKKSDQWKQIPRGKKQYLSQVAAKVKKNDRWLMGLLERVFDKYRPGYYETYGLWLFTKKEAE